MAFHCAVGNVLIFIVAHCFTLSCELSIFEIGIKQSLKHSKVATIFQIPKAFIILIWMTNHDEGERAIESETSSEAF